MKKNHVIIAVVVAGIIAAAMIVLFIYMGGSTWLTSTSDQRISCEYMRQRAIELDQLSREIYDLEVAIGQRWGTNDPQVPYWVEDLPDRIKEYNNKAAYYNKYRKQAGHCGDLPTEYFLQEEKTNGDLEQEE